MSDWEVKEGGDELDPAQELQLVEKELRQVEAQIERLLHRQAQLVDQRDRLQQRVAAEARAPRRDWRGSFPWDAAVDKALWDVFKLMRFRPLQREIINATLQGRDALCLLPAGGGKSLCFQLPAAMEGQAGVTLVISPLLSLIQDQVLGLRAAEVPAAALTSLTSKEEAAEVYNLLDDKSSDLRLVYCTPEKIVNSKRFIARLEKLYKDNRLARIAVDEAHCCSSWGNDFRPDFKKLGVLKQQFPQVPILALTATATSAVCDDLRSILRIEGCEVFKSSVDRANLFYEVRAKPATPEGVADDLAGWVKDNFPHGESGIVYCLTRKDAEQVAEQLLERGLSCCYYHADVEPAAREAVHRQWSAGQIQIIVATVAFGMGINKVDVHFVVHHGLPKSLENFYQESGRAGRDGKPAHCRLYFRLADYLRQVGVVAMEPGWEKHLHTMLGLVTTPSCRRAYISQHFGEAPAPCHAMCDVCKAEAAAAPAAAAGAGAAAAATAAAAAEQARDVSEAAQGVLETLASKAGEERRATLVQLLSNWRSNKDGGIGAAAKRLSSDEAERVVQQMLLDQALTLDIRYTAYSANTYLKAGPWAQAVLQGKRRVLLPAAQPEAAGEEAHRPAASPRNQRGWEQPAQQVQQQPEVVELSDDSAEQAEVVDLSGDASGIDSSAFGPARRAVPAPSGKRRRSG